MKDHPFLDGNKRTGFIVAVTFLELNGLRLRLDWGAGLTVLGQAVSCQQTAVPRASEFSMAINLKVTLKKGDIS